MSIFTTLAEDGLSAAVKLIPMPYLLGAGAVLAISLFIGGKIWFHNKVEAEAQKIITAYIAKDKKEEADLAAIVIADNAKIKFVLQTQEKTITQTVVVNHNIIVNKVPDSNTILSTGWIDTFNASVKGVPVDSTVASNAVPSGVNADQALDTVNTNNGICQTNLALLNAAQKFLTDQQAAVAAENKKNGVK